MTIIAVFMVLIIGLSWHMTIRYDKTMEPLYNGDVGFKLIHVNTEKTYEVVKDLKTECHYVETSRGLYSRMQRDSQSNMAQYGCKNMEAF